MKIAAVTDDGEIISRHFGRAKFYAIYTVEDGQIVATEKVEKPAHGRHRGGGQVHLHEEGDDHQHDHGDGHDHDHGDHDHGDHDHDHGDMIAPVRDCEIVLTRGMGYGAHRALSAAGLRPIITDIAQIADAVQAVIDDSITDHPEKLH